MRRSSGPFSGIDSGDGDGIQKKEQERREAGQSVSGD